MIVSLLVTLFTLLITPVYAQEASPSATPDPMLFEQYKKDYLFQRDVYQKSLQNYNEKDRVNIQYSTVATQNDKLNALKETLINRNKMLRSYLMALRVHINDFRAVNFDDTNKIQADISNYEQWLDQQNQTINSLSSLDAVKNWAGDFKVKYIDVQKAMYSGLVQNEVNLDLQTLNEINNVTNEVQTLPQVTDNDKVLIANIKNKPDTILAYLKEAIAITQKPQLNPTKFNEFYPEAKSELNHARENLSEMAANIKLVVTKITD